MSQKSRYCVSCGTKHLIGLVEIRFCSCCGTPFDATAANKASTTAASQPKKVTDVVEDQPEESGIPQISASDFSIDKPKKLTIEDIKNNPGVGGSRGESASPKLTPEQAQANFAALFTKERESSE